MCDDYLRTYLADYYDCLTTAKQALEVLDLKSQQVLPCANQFEYRRDAKFVIIDRKYILLFGHIDSVGKHLLLLNSWKHHKNMKIVYDEIEF